MEKFATLEPIRLYEPAPLKPAFKSAAASKLPAASYVGRLPIDVHILVLSHLSVPDIPAYSRCSHSTAHLAKEDRVWERRWSALCVQRYQLDSVLDELQARTKSPLMESHDPSPPTIPVDSLDDDFGDFTSANTSIVLGEADEMGDFVGALQPSAPAQTTASPSSYRALFMRAHTLLKPQLGIVSEESDATLRALASSGFSSLGQQAKMLHLLALFLSPAVQPVRAYEKLALALRSAADRFDAQLLYVFEVADGGGDEEAMREAAGSSWELWDGGGEWEMGKVWAEKREIFYEQDRWNPLDNIAPEGRLVFDAMDDFMTHTLSSLAEHGARAVRVFPAASKVVLSFAERVANETVGEYITSLLARARELSTETFLKATPAAFKEAWRLVDTVISIAGESGGGMVTMTQAEDVIYRMFEENMDDYLDGEIDFVKTTFNAICREWETKMAQHITFASSSSASSSSGEQQSHFLSAQNPAQVKRHVLASFADVLLLPVTIVPRTVGVVGAALTTGGNAAAQGIAMLNPQRWVESVSGRTAAYSKHLEDGRGEGGNMLFEAGGDAEEDEEEEEKEVEEEKEEMHYPEVPQFPRTSTPTLDTLHLDVPTGNWETVHPTATSSTHTPSRTHTSTPSQAHASTPSLTHTSTPSRTDLSTPQPAPPPALSKLELLLSLDVALELIHADREALKRAETFAGYPGHYGHRVHDAIEVIFVLLLQAMGERHVSPGFSRAIEQMANYKPAEHEATASVAPLLQFFELVHVGDTIQSMVQVYFDKELAPRIDGTDFLNSIVREKRKFENALDDSVAAGLNAGTEVLMNQVEYIINTLTKPREYYPPEDAPLELGQTMACREAIRCLETHCRLLKGSTNKEVLEVFYQEIGIRLIAILQKHIKRQIISLNGGFQVIADLNAYHAFVASLKVPTITVEFAHLKMLGHVYVVEDAKDLAQIVRDVTRYGGAYRPEDVYEFIQRRSDWKKIEKVVDKTMYSLSFKEDCIIS